MASSHRLLVWVPVVAAMTTTYGERARIFPAQEKARLLWNETQHDLWLLHYCSLWCLSAVWRLVSAIPTRYGCSSLSCALFIIGGLSCVFSPLSLPFFFHWEALFENIMVHITTGESWAKSIRPAGHLSGLLTVPAGRVVCAKGTGRLEGWPPVIMILEAGARPQVVGVRIPPEQRHNWSENK